MLVKTASLGNDSIVCRMRLTTCIEPVSLVWFFKLNWAESGSTTLLVGRSHDSRLPSRIRRFLSPHAQVPGGTTTFLQPVRYLHQSSSELQKNLPTTPGHARLRTALPRPPGRNLREPPGGAPRGRSRTAAFFGTHVPPQITHSPPKPKESFPPPFPPGSARPSWPHKAPRPPVSKPPRAAAHPAPTAPPRY